MHGWCYPAKTTLAWRFMILSFLLISSQLIYNLTKDARNVCIVCMIPYSRKYWWGLKFGSLAAGEATVKLKSTNISYTQIYVWQYRTEPPNLNPPIFLFQPLKTKSPIFPAIWYLRAACVFSKLIPARMLVALDMLCLLSSHCKKANCGGK